MTEKDVEKRITDALSESGERSPRVLDAARAEMKRNKRSLWSRPAFRYALVGTLSVVLCLAVVLPVIALMRVASSEYADYAVESDSGSAPSANKSSGGTKAQNGSMHDYFVDHGIGIETFDRLTDADGTQEDVAIEGRSSAYVATNYTERKIGGEIVALTEKYLYGGTDEITVSVLLTDDEDVRQTLFGDFLSDPTESTRYAGVDISYSYDEAIHVGRAVFSCAGLAFFTTFAVEDESAMLTHLQTFLLAQ